MAKPVRIRSLLAAALLVAALGAPGAARAGVVRVTSDADSGEGSLRAAIEAANANRAITVIWFMRRALEIELASGLEYTGAQPLFVEGLGATLRSAAGGAFPLLASRGGASLLLRSLTLRGSGAQGLYVELPANARGVPWLRLVAVNATQNAGCGIQVSDPSGSAAGVFLLLIRGEFTANGSGLCIDESGPGNVWATLQFLQVSGSAGDGIALRESGPGSVVLTLSGSRVNANGFVDPLLPGDGLSLAEADSGELRALVATCSFDGNAGRGLALGEAGDGSSLALLSRATARSNGGDGVRLAEEGAGNLVSNAIALIATGGGGDGLVFEELGAGILRGLVGASQATGNAGSGIAAAQEAPGTGTLLVSRSSVGANGGEQLELSGVALSLR